MIDYVPIESQGRLSGLISLDTRKSSEPTREAVASLLSTSLTILQPRTIAGVDVLVSGRITYLDRLIEAISSNARNDDLASSVVGYRDALMTMDRPFGNSLLSGTLFHTRDRRPFGNGNDYAWGENLSGLRLTRLSGPWRFDSRASFDRATAYLGDDPGPSGVQQFVKLKHDWTSAMASAERAATRWALKGGVSIDARAIEQVWTGSPEGFFTPHAPRAYRGSQSQQRAAGFLELTTSLGAVSAASVGIRNTWVAGTSFSAPSLLLTTPFQGGSTLSFALSRRYQFETELEEPVEGSGKQPVFLLSRPRIADVGAVSLRRESSGGNWEVTSFYKQYKDRATLQGNPRALEDSLGMAVDSFPLFNRVPGHSYGATASITRQFGSRTLLQGSYTFQRVFERIDGHVAPAAWDAPHNLSLFLTTPLSAKWSFNVVSQWHSGAPTTPVLARIFAPDEELSPFLRPRYIPGPTNSGRLPDYRRVDIGVRRETKRGHTEIAFNAQVLNVFARRNALEYDWASAFCSGSSACRTPKASRAGLPIIPSLGIEIRW
jgi:hypothetical protein